MTTTNTSIYISVPLLIVLMKVNGLEGITASESTAKIKKQNKTDKQTCGFSCDCMSEKDYKQDSQAKIKCYTEPHLSSWWNSLYCCYTIYPRYSQTMLVLCH